MDIRRQHLHHPAQTMRAIFLYIALGAVAVNVAGNIAANTAEGLQQQRADRIEKLCAVNTVYCG